MTRQEKLEAAYKAIVEEHSQYSFQPRMDMVPERSDIRIYPEGAETCIYNPEYYFKVADVFGLSTYIQAEDSLPYIIIF